MSSLQQPSRFVTFTNNPQRSQLLPPGGFPQSLSGSETDVSTSIENLSHEERYVIRHTARQEPQGQENLSSNRSSLDVSSSSYNTLIIHGAGDEPWTGRLSAKMGSHSPSPGATKEVSNRMSFDGSPSNRLFDPNGREITDIPDDYLSQSQVLKHLAKEVKVTPSSSVGTSERDSSILLDHSDGKSSNYSDNTSDQLNNRLSLSSSGKVGPQAITALPYSEAMFPPPPQYPKWSDPPRMAADKLTLSRSQPDLSRIGANKAGALCRNSVASPRPKTNGREDVDSRDEIWPPAEMVEILIQENSALKLELETCYQKVAKSQKLEQEIGNIHRAHEEMILSSERRERLERAARGRLQSDCRRLHEMNRALREQCDMLAAQLRPQSSMAEPDGLRKELTKRELLIAQLITQNKELVAAKERQEIELAAQRATLQEQRTHIDILDTALTNAQGNVVRLEEECRKKQMYVERVTQLQRALASLQLASDRREQTERKLRLQLERELRSERARGSSNASEGGEGGGRGGGGAAPGESAPELKRQLREREEKIMRLEGEVAKWEQRYLEESALRQAAIDAASIPKDAKIAALEKTSQDSEKLISEARTEKIRHMDEVHASQKRVTDLESRLKEQESRLAERDAMIRVLQKHTYDKDMSVASSYLGRSPHHTPHPSSLHTNSDLGTVMGSREELDPVSNTSVFSTVSSYTGSDSYTTLARAKYANQSFDDTKKSLDDQLKELDSQLDSQLLSKRALCCFPGFSNSSAASRKGKISKPLLAGVGGGFEAGAGFLQGLVAGPRYEQGRPEEMLLLEKQGRCSQQQRMQETCLGARIRSGSLPPTSLPRPHRTHRPPGATKLGEYGRLSDGEGRKAALEEMENSGKRRESQMSSPRRLGEYARLSGGEGKKIDGLPIRSNVPPPRRLGEYGRLSDGDGRKVPAGRSSPAPSHLPSPRKLGEYGRLSDGSIGSPGSRAGSRAGSSSKSVRDSGSDDLGSQSKLLPGPRAHSLTRDSSKSDDAKSTINTGKYRIQF